MDRAEILRHELQMQQARIAKENQERDKKLVSAYGAVADLNFVGFSPVKLQEHIPSSFLRGSYSHCKLPSVDFPETKSHNLPVFQPPVGPVPPIPAPVGVPPAPASPALPQPLSKRQRKKKNKTKSATEWDSEWVAPKVYVAPKVRFGHNNWSSRMVIDITESSDEEPDVADQAIDSEEAAKREAELKARIAQLHINHRAMENHIQQLSLSLEKQQENLEKKRKELSATLEEYKQANEQLVSLACLPKKRRRSTTLNPNESCGGPTKMSKSIHSREAPATQSSQLPVTPSPVPMNPEDTSAEPQSSCEQEDTSSDGIKTNTTSSEIPTGFTNSGTNGAGSDTENTSNQADAQSLVVTSEHKALPKTVTAPVAIPEPKQVPNQVSNQEPKNPVSHQSTASQEYVLNSPMALFNSYRISKMFVKGDPSRVYSHTYNSPFVEDKELCVTNLDGKPCDDEKCEYSHFSDYEVPSQQVITYILKNFVDSATKKKFVKALTSLENPDSVNSMELLLSFLGEERQ